MKKIIDQTSEFEKLIDIIVNPVDESTEAYALKLVHVIYDKGWRHSYSLITRRLLKLQIDELNDALQLISANVQELINDINSEIDNYDDCNESANDPEKYSVSLRRCHRNLEKLKDHVTLELMRIDGNKAIEAKVINLHQLVSKKLDNTSEKLESIEGKAEKLEKEYKNQRTESITILGVFTAIIGVIGVGVTLSASIFSNMNSIGNWRLYALTCLIVLFVTNILTALFDFLRDMTDKEKKKNDYLWIFNIGLLFFSFVCFLLSFTL
ncbi:hypothetical protein [Succinivibrio dextrinosolvens]|uniref:hypothetical protein n=1 Tax=Succinivibrio dextrinosolvens TaxID=83771 RepID=UPI0004E1892C|nr:hypothetical protein [Succinivibrio dextrinosolvens]